MSSYYMAAEVRQTYVGMMVALPPETWSEFQTLSASQLAKVLRRMAEHAAAGPLSQETRVGDRRRPPPPPR